MNHQSIQDRIQSLDDTTARRVLTIFARAQPPQPETQLTPALAQALREFAPEPAAGPVTEGDIARTALRLLADDPNHQPILTALIDGPAPQKMAILETAGVIVAVLIEKSGTVEKSGTDHDLHLFSIFVPRKTWFVPYFFMARQRARRGEHLSPTGEDCRGAARLRGGGAVVSPGAGD
jgi:hypothetical protein